MATLAPQPMSTEEKKVIFASLLGTVFEWYDFYLQDIIQAAVKTKVMLLSATPVSNDLKYLRNQLYLVSEGRDHPLVYLVSYPILPAVPSTPLLSPASFTACASTSTRRYRLLKRIPKQPTH